MFKIRIHQPAAVNKRLGDPIGLPSIIHWNFNHYVVFEGIKGDRVYLNDPASGPRTVSMDEFDASYTGVVLAFEPTPEFRPRGGAPSLMAAMGARLENAGAAVAFVIGASLLLVVAARVWAVSGEPSAPPAARCAEPAWHSHASLRSGAKR